jgi:hypothetical protein
VQTPALQASMALQVAHMAPLTPQFWDEAVWQVPVASQQPEQLELEQLPPHPDHAAMAPTATPADATTIHKRLIQPPKTRAR